MPPNSPTVTHTSSLRLAHRASSGLWIQNTRLAVEKTLALYRATPTEQRLFHGIEVDVVLTKDHIPVLAHDPWVHTRLCRRTDNQTMSKALIKTMTLAQLHSEYRCGGIRDIEFPSADTREEPIMTLEALLMLVKQCPSLIIYLDSKIEPPLTASADDYAQAIFNTIARTQTNNPLYLEGPTVEAIHAYRRHANQPVTTLLSYPAFFSRTQPWLTTKWAAIKHYFLPSVSARKAVDANADGIAMPFQLARSRTVRALLKYNKQLVLFTPNTISDIQKAETSGAHITITDFPLLTIK